MPLFSDPTPRPLDSEWALLAKIAQLLQDGCAGGGGGTAGVLGISVNGGPIQTGFVSLATGSGVQAVNGDAGPLVLLDSADIPEGASNFYYTSARFDTSFAGKTTTNLAEGANLYFSDARVRAAILTGFVAGAGTVTAADSVLTAIQKLSGNQASFITSVNGDTGPAVLLDSGEIPEGANLYYTAARFNTAFAAKTTTDLAEGANLYFTNARAIAATLTGYVAAAGTVTAADTILTALQKVGFVTNDLLNFRDTNSHADASIYINSGATEIVKVVGSTTFVQLNTSRIHRNVSSSTLSILSGTGTTDGAFTEYRGDTASSPGAITHVTKGTADYSIKVAPIASGVASSLWVLSSIGNVTQTPTWNDAGTAFVALDVNATNTASAAGALLGRFRASSVDQWTLSKVGSTVQAGGGSFSAAKVLIDSTTGNVSISPTANTGGVQIVQSATGSGFPIGVFVSATWNTTGAPSAIAVNLTNTASGAGARLLDLLKSAVSQFSVDVNGNVVGLGTLSAAAALFTVSATGVLQLANGTALGANPTAATSQWAVGGEWQYRSSAASEGAGQTNRVHNRGEAVFGAGTDYAMTTSMARIDFGTTDPEVVLPTAGTYLVLAQVQFQADAASAADIHGAQLRNSTDATFISHEGRASLGALFLGSTTLVAEVTITASKTIQVWARNSTSARGTVLSSGTAICYERLY